MDDSELSCESVVTSESVRFHLREALGDLRNLVQELEESEVDVEEFKSIMAHLYHHINSAWNSRSIEQLDDPRLTEQFYELALFPTDISAWNSEPD
jgi:signal transduction histidine kinase